MIENINETDNETHKTCDQFESNLQSRINDYFEKENMSKSVDKQKIPDEIFNSIVKRAIFSTFGHQYFHCVTIAILAEGMGIF